MVGGAIVAGALGGAAAGLTGALLNGANLGQIARATFTGGFWGAAGSFLAFAGGEGAFLERLFKHSFSQAWLEGIRGGNMKHGLMAGLASVAGGEAIMEYAGNAGKAVKVALNSVVAGTASELGGGKFANGAMTGAFAMLFNDLMHQKEEKAVISDKDKVWGKMSIMSNVNQDADLMEGHAWIRLESVDGKTIKTMSLWGNRGEQEFWENQELNEPAMISKSRNITVSQYNKIAEFNSIPKNIDWTLKYTCAGYSAKLWNYVTGDNLSARDLFNSTTPRSLSRSINKNPY